MANRQWFNPYSLSGKAGDILRRKPDIRDDELAFLLNLELAAAHQLRQDFGRAMTHGTPLPDYSPAALACGAE